MATELISLGILFVCAIIGGIIANKFRQPAVFGLLLVGALIGPSSLNLVQDAKMINMMAEFGAILILFIIGLEFDMSKLMKLGARSILIGLLKFAIVLFFGYETTLLLGFSSKVALFVGVILSFSSTVVVVKLLEQKEMFTRKEVPLLIAILLIEDVLAVFALTFFASIKDSSAGIVSTLEHIIFAMAILIVAYLITLKLLKSVVNAIMKNSSDESVLTFLSLGIGALFSYFAASLGLTPSAGAFLAGSLIASLPNSKEYGKAIHPYALIFTSIFFISMGTLISFDAVRSNAVLIGALLLTLVISRFVAIGFLTYLLANFKDEQPFFSSIAMISVGEFSLLVAKQSENFNLGIDLVSITAAIIFISAIITSFGLNYSDKMHSGMGSRAPIKTRLKMERLASYMRRFFDQTEIENFFTKKLKAESRKALLLVIIAIFAAFLLRRIFIILESRLHFLFVYSFYVIASVIMIYLLHLIYGKLKEVHRTFTIILTNVDSSRNPKKCAMILNNSLIGLLLFFSAMLFPFAMFAFDLAPVFNIAPFLLVIVSYYYLKRLVILIDGSPHYAPSYNATLSMAKF